MYERCLNEAERVLASDKDVIVAVKKIWSLVSEEGKRQGFDVPTFGDFSAMLEGDPRFEFLASHESVTEDLEDRFDDEDSPEEMEQLGFFSGDRVKLRKVDLTPTMLGSIIRSKVDRTMTALTKAWELRPNGDQETEDKLLEILARTQKLQKEVSTTFSDQRMESLEKSLKTGPRKRKTPRRKPARAVNKSSRKTPARKKTKTARALRKGKRR